METWVAWIRRNYSRLARGDKLRAPADLPHPSRAGFRVLSVAEPAGQVADYVLRLSDGSRIHVHECRDGSWVVHRDRFDPEVSPFHAVAHVAIETGFGRGLLAGAAVVLLGAAVSSLRA